MQREDDEQDGQQQRQAGHGDSSDPGSGHDASSANELPDVSMKIYEALRDQWFA
ncbi:hypothetical protein [Xanthomonas hortorum]|uniref:hypothetical protein n=1 Tax=Xanthomonas hortorum TaxID=56454 RepID=UPI0035A93363